MTTCVGTDGIELEEGQDTVLLQVDLVPEELPLEDIGHVLLLHLVDLTDLLHQGFGLFEVVVDEEAWRFEVE